VLFQKISHDLHQFMRLQFLSAHGTAPWLMRLAISRFTCCCVQSGCSVWMAPRMITLEDFQMFPAMLSRST